MSGKISKDRERSPSLSGEEEDLEHIDKKKFAISCAVLGKSKLSFWPHFPRDLTAFQILLESRDAMIEAMYDCFRNLVLQPEVFSILYGSQHRSLVVCISFFC